jgi:hypothetical protein
MNQTDAAPTPISVAGSSGWTAGRVAALAIGSVLILASLGLLAGAGIGLWADLTQRDAGYVTPAVHDLSTTGSALVTEPTKLGSAGVGWLYSPVLLDKVRIRVTPQSSSGRPLFVGIARSDDVDRYLAGVKHTLVTDFFGGKSEAVGGGAARSVPADQHFWAASSTGAGKRTVVWDPADGSWTVVVMNADARPGIDVKADFGARMPNLGWLSVGFLAAGAILLAGGALLVVGAIRRRRAAMA